MPTREAIVDNIIPKPVEKPIPTRTVSTKGQRIESKIAGQPITSSSPVEEKAAPEESVKLSPQLSALARKEQAFRQKELALKQRETSMEQKLKLAEEYEILKQKLGSKDFSEAEKLGLNYEEYTKYKIDKANGEDPQLLRIQELEAKIEALTKGQEENASAQYEETVAEYKKEISKLVGDNPEFSSIKGLKGEEAVLQLILDSFNEDGEELTVYEASKIIEDELVERGKVFSALPKLKPKEPEIEVEVEKALPRPMVGKTLTNDMSASADKRPYKSLQHLSEAERYAEARRRVLERRTKDNR